VGSIASIVFAARGARAIADGFVSLVLPLYLLALGYTPRQVGVLSTATLLGSAALSLAAGLYATRIGSILGLWLVQRFALAPAELGALFFGTSLLAGASYLIAAPLARRFGLINTMVFTHIPSSLALIAIPFVDDVRVAVVLLLVRSALSRMDVPTRSSYVVAVVTPAERPAAASATAAPRSLAAAGSPLLTGYLLGLSPFGWPLVVAGAFKIGYDLTLLMLFRNVRPPEEVEQARDATARS